MMRPVAPEGMRERNARTRHPVSKILGFLDMRSMQSNVLAGIDHSLMSEHVGKQMHDVGSDRGFGEGLTFGLRSLRVFARV